MTTSFDFTGRTALVTGAASGLGLAMARALSKSGARLVLFDLDGDGLAKAAAELNLIRPDSMTPFTGSITDQSAVKAACDLAVELGGGLDIVMNNAGIAGNAPSLDLEESVWRNAVDVNLTGTFLMAQAAGRVMAANGGGSIINTASMYGVVAAPERAAYCATKAAVVALTKVLAIEWADRNIRVNAIGPGYVRTALTETLVEQGRLDLDALNARVPAGRLGTPEEIATAALFLASDASAYVTGQTLVADGGWSSYSYL
ncbi:SDR family NAD(P)-dependent oxidoreductase [Pacificibacter marinus]|uniref:SDR family NAD(P)-dependent oxidoreductase n=1 Tax=Pacificibacter marinus TaxID=658057 RepID=UPI001C070FD0|nr:SDR family NAD(P)-dependent oxidoreductase [Pacificibacter marinus]MBU2867803.1 SDR family oxidoreductase [Pacificibacter marinus]